jgi:CBS domain-containing protein
MKKKESVRNIMSANVVSVQLNDSLSEVSRLIKKHHIRHVPVENDGKLVGIISRTDIDRLTFSALMPGEGEVDESVFEMLTIGHVMTNKPRVVSDETTIHEVATILSKEEFHALPVVAKTDNTSLLGIVTTTDVIKYMLDHWN